MKKNIEKKTPEKNALSMLKTIKRLQAKHFRLNMKCQAILKEIEIAKNAVSEMISKGEF